MSDLGLATLFGDTGLFATARSLSSGAPLDGVTFELLARNNKILATVDSDTEGVAVFDPGFIRGTGDNAPRVLIARLGDDFAFLDLESAAMDRHPQAVRGRYGGLARGRLLRGRGLRRFGRTDRHRRSALEDYRWRWYDSGYR